MAKCPLWILLFAAALSLPACSSNDGSSAPQTAAPTASNTGTGTGASTTDSDSRFLSPTAPVGAIAVESSPLEGRYIPVQRGPVQSGRSQPLPPHIPPAPALPGQPVSRP